MSSIRQIHNTISKLQSLSDIRTDIIENQNSDLERLRINRHQFNTLQEFSEECDNLDLIHYAELYELDNNMKKLYNDYIRLTRPLGTPANLFLFLISISLFIIHKIKYSKKMSDNNKLVDILIFFVCSWMFYFSFLFTAFKIEILSMFLYLFASVILYFTFKGIIYAVNKNFKIDFRDLYIFGIDIGMKAIGMYILGIIQFKRIFGNQKRLSLL